MGDIRRDEKRRYLAWRMGDRGCGCNCILLVQMVLVVYSVHIAIVGSMKRGKYLALKMGDRECGCNCILLVQMVLVVRIAIVGDIGWEESLERKSIHHDGLLKNSSVYGRILSLDNCS